MLMPKKIKFRKVQKGKLKGLSKGARTVYFWGIWFRSG